MQLDMEYAVLVNGDGSPYPWPKTLPERLNFIAQGYRNDAQRYQGDRHAWRLRRAERLEKLANL